MKKEIVDIRYVAKVLFLMTTSFNLGHTFDQTWLSLLFALFFAVTGFMNATSRREFSKRPRYNKISAYGAIVPLALYWVVTPGVENGVNPMMIFLPGLYLLFLAALQERSRGNGGFESFVAFDGVAALLLGMYMVPRGFAWVGVCGLLLALFAYGRRGTSWCKYLLFILLIACLGGISYGGWKYWRSHRNENGGRWASEYVQRERVMGFDPVVSLGSFSENFKGKFNDQVVLRVWDTLSPRYLKAAVYEKYVAGVWKLPQKPLKILTPAYYQVDYSVMEVEDSLTRSFDKEHLVRQVWVQSALKNFGFIFSPYGSVGFAAKDLDSLMYFAGNMVKGLDANGKRSDWYYFVCAATDCETSDSLKRPMEGDLDVFERYNPFLDSIIASLDLRSDAQVFEKIGRHFGRKYSYALTIPNLEKWKEGGPQDFKDPLTVFVREKKGYCEYYATLATLLLRRLGIPARYVSGFANPEKLDGRPYAIFRRKHSHAWVEAFVDNRWLVFDPTPPVVNFEQAKSDWIGEKMESLRGRLARIMHVIKEGRWRESLESWQNAIQNLLDGWALYVMIVSVGILFAGRRFFLIIKNRRQNNVIKNEKAVRWINVLEKAENEVRRLGLHRESGETVSAFIKRLEKFKAKNLPDSQKIEGAVTALKEYEANRWK